MKTGRLSKTEIVFIDEHLDTMTDAEIAAHLDRSIEPINQRRASKSQRDKNADGQEYVAQLHKKHFWDVIKSSLLAEEIPYFQDSWAALYAQFVDQRVTATDEMMMKDVIIDDILLHRALGEKRNIIAEIRRLEDEITMVLSKPFELRTQEENDRIINNQRHVVQLRGTQEDYSREINEIKKAKDNKFKDLKATRQERLKTVEEAGRNFFSLVKLLDEHHMREKEGRMTALVCEAAKKIKGEMQQPHQFLDGEIDTPFALPEGEVK